MLQDDYDEALDYVFNALQRFAHLNNIGVDFRKESRVYSNI